MKIFHLSLIGSTLIFSFGCYDINNLPQMDDSSGNHLTTHPREIPEVRKVYPVQRTITDVQGRQIDATVLGKQGIEIAISKGLHGKKFIVPLELLSRDDQDYFESLGEGGNVSGVKKKLEQEARLAGRVARWHMDVTSAEREAVKLDLPMMLAVMVTGNEESAALEKKLGYSNEFRDWAGKNLVLCMLKVDDPSSNRTSSFSAVGDRNTAARYGIVEYTSPSVMLVKPDKGAKARLSSIALSSPDSAIRAVSSALDGGGWSAIVAREAPEKKRASVNGGATIASGGGGG